MTDLISRQAAINAVTMGALSTATLYGRTVDMIGKGGEWINCDGSEWLALAWMPIPKPWEGEEHGASRTVLPKKSLR